MSDPEPATTKTSGEGTRGQEGCCKEIDQETSQQPRSYKALQKACC